MDTATTLSTATSLTQHPQTAAQVAPGALQEIQRFPRKPVAKPPSQASKQQRSISVKPTNNVQTIKTSQSASYDSGPSRNQSYSLVYSKKPRPVTFTPYILSDYNLLKKATKQRLGGLGPSYVGTSLWQREKFANDRRLAYGKRVRAMDYLVNASYL